MFIQLPEKGPDNTYVDIPCFHRTEISIHATSQIAEATAGVLTVILPPVVQQFGEHDRLEFAAREVCSLSNLGFSLCEDVFGNLNRRLPSTLADYVAAFVLESYIQDSVTFVDTSR